MKFKTFLIAACAVVLSCVQVLAQATILPPGMTCFQAQTGINGMLGTLGTITGGSAYTNGAYGGVSLTGGSGSQATANITVSGGIVTQVTVLNPGIQYVVGDVLSAAAANIGGTGSGFSVAVASTSINSSLAGGSVSFFIPNTQTFKQTWQDAAETTNNQNPVPLDQNGCAVIYGNGIYLMVVQDSLGNTVYSKLTASTGPTGVFWAALATGTPNAIAVTDSAFSHQDGTVIQFLAAVANNGPVTVAVSGGAAIALIKDTPTGPAPLTGGEIGPANTPMITYDATNVQFHLVNPAASGGGSTSSGSLVPPQGYLNLIGQASGDVIQTGDVVGAVTVYYSPFVGNQIPIFNGSAFVNTTFSELTTTLTASGSTSNTIQDECVFSNNGVPTLVAGPSWSNVSAGSGSRGSGAGSAQIIRLQGIWVNANSYIAYNGLSSYTIPANQCTMVGSLSIDASAGQVSAYKTYGQSRKWGVWNFYNRQQITMIGGDNTATWSYTPNTVRAANGNSANSITIFTGLSEEPFDLNTTAFVGGSIGNSQTAAGQVGIGYNSTTVLSGKNGITVFSNGAGTAGNTFNNSIAGSYKAAPAIGINVITALENGLGATVSTWNGTQNFMLLSAQYRG